MTAENKGVDINRFRVPHERLTCLPFNLKFSTTAELEPLKAHELIGQPRVENALARGLANPGHIFVVADSISTALLENLRLKAATPKAEDAVKDLVCVYNFERPEKPRFIELQKGHACQFKLATGKLLEWLKEKIPEGILSDEFREQEKSYKKSVSEKIEKELQNLKTVAREEIVQIKIGDVSFALSFSQAGINIFPTIASDQHRNMTLKEYDDLEESDKKEVEDLRARWMDEAARAMGRVRELEHSSSEQIAATRADLADKLFVEKSADILSSHGEQIFNFIEGLRVYTREHVSAFLRQTNGSERDYPMPVNSQSDQFIPFEINVQVDNAATCGVPVIDYRNVDHARLFGEISYAIGAGGVPIGGHMSVRAGLLSEANHGILVLSAVDVLNKGLWPRLKAVLETKRLDLGSDNSNPFVRGNVRPETLRIDVKLVLVGDHSIYRTIMSTYFKSEFYEIFRTVAEFDYEIKRTEETVNQLAQLISLFCKREGMPPVSTDGVAELLKYLSRKSGNQSKFSLDVRSLKDVLNEAAWRAGDSGVISRENVQQAIRDKIYRVSLVREKVYELCNSGTMLLSLAGCEVGQVNGLVVYDTGYIYFGAPSRITSRVFAGQAGVISIDREAKMSASTHSKGVLILAGYLGGKYGQDKKVSLSATLVFEQSYGILDGDSGSSAELYCILSALADVPLRQDIAVTGSINQMGEIQPIGGISEKTEGFFDIANAFGLTGTQGVMIPKLNIDNLILREDVIEAIKAGKFHLYAIETVEEGMGILTGQNMGERMTDGAHKGEYPPSSINYMVENKLRKLARASANGDTKK